MLARWSHKKLEVWRQPIESSESRLPVALGLALTLTPSYSEPFWYLGVRGPTDRSRSCHTVHGVKSGYTYSDVLFILQ